MTPQFFKETNVRRPGKSIRIAAVFAIVAAIALSASPETNDPQVSNAVKLPDRGWGAAGTNGPDQEAPPIVETIKLSGNQAGNYRYPGVAENKNGDRLVIFRGPDNLYWYRFCKNGATWSAPAVIAGQPYLSEHLTADIDVDSDGRFHCVWEQPGSAVVYASFLDGRWTAPVNVPTGRHEYGVSIAVRSNDEAVVANTEVVFVPSLTKDVVIYRKGKNDTQFHSPTNLTGDAASSSQAWIAVDPNNHMWAAFKDELDPGPPEILAVSIIHVDQNNRVVEKRTVSQEEGWSFWPQVAVNSEGKVMTAWPHSSSGDYWSRLYNPATKAESPLAPLKTGLSTSPWCTFFSRLAAHGKDFYMAAMTPGRTLYLLKYDEASSSWSRIAQVSDRSVETFDLYSGSDKMLVVWGGFDDPADVFLTTVSADPLGPQQLTLTIQAGAGGTTNPAPGSYDYDRDGSVTVTAVPDFAFRLKEWSGDASGDAASVTVTMDRDKTLKANFAAIPIPKPPLNSTVATELDVSQTTKTNTLAWAANPENAGMALKEHWVYRKRAGEPDSEFLKVGAVAAAAFQYADRGLPCDRKFAYRVTALPDDPYGKESAGSSVAAEVSVFPPLALTCKTVSNSSLFRTETINAISWRANPLNEPITVSQYNLFRKKSGQPDAEYKLIASVAGVIVEYQDRKLPAGEKYTYVIRTIDSGGLESANSNPAGTSTLTP